MTMINAFDGSGEARLDPQDKALIARRASVLGPAYRLFYEEPLHIQRGKGVWLWDRRGRRYLDAYNNVASLGHCHPRVIEAVSAQLGVLNTHTRYLHEDVVIYAERLLATMPDALGHVMFTCTGSEANDLALRIARSRGGRQGVVVTRLAYHGLTEAVSELSPSLGEFVPRGPRVRLIEAPDGLRVPAADQGARLAADLARAIAGMRAEGIEPAAFIADTIFSSDGLHPEPAGFLRPAVELIRAEGGVFIADEVQPGFARTGEAFWGFTRHGLVPDMVTMGKPMGNGFPVSGVAMRPELVREFGARSRYFNTFGGSPVAAAAGLAVLDVIRDEGLQDNALRIGAFLKAGLDRIAARHEAIGDVRGAGLFLAVECVTRRETNAPDAALAGFVVNHLRQNGVLISATGPGANILKIRPPLVLQQPEAEILLDAVETAFAAAVP
ncbi:MAG: aspartate aminotransferase family protein [Paracoccus sp. (in: a-proteobacteria)]|uniref:aspartate aminotransferase family protein n=1 Tax=unclassified Paracoccus (in: a-proteobacteria) TaxID=2688777 RepID=UPI000C4F2B81|nr:MULTISPECIES: aspartate aminotransferase family protein [unclassified Paracoccus (in: a-proteobacteria)]MAN56129.1 aspartate aminotransferase family protein [Paracoccus sp. (in: a-proteobacteria)]MBA49642.1 aspartate aminotransferase family protein [Paracoccus sp. (in: a-proteobacteria)]MCS5601404.1 aspartate aminotransferase family protein [Paracoccus sp. (in: a-proteobacteria)]|tara:strand:- start:1087 stop:2409 length:1323 start_codon:yes stop_codon:yes gene_type:complete